MKLRRLYKYIVTNYLVALILLIIFIVGIIYISRTLIAKPTYIYARVKVGQGLWWVNTAKANIWHVDAINKGDIEKDLVGRPIAEVLSKRFYRWYTSDQYDVYLTLKLKVSVNKKTGEYTFERSQISVGSPITLQFPKAYITGTVSEISFNPIQDKYEEKKVYLTKRNAYPWEYDAIQIGDKYFDGEDTVFNVINKEAKETTNLSSDPYGNNTPDITEPRSFITVVAKVKLKKVDNQWIMGEDQVVSVGRNINVSTLNFGFTDYIVSKIE